jgi:hypothetical protein
MTELTADAFRTVGPGDAVPHGLVVSFYLSDRKLRGQTHRVQHLVRGA